MIYNVSYRTDVPAFFWPWWTKRLKEQFVDVRNPYFTEKISRLSLNPKDVDAIVYISKDFSKTLTAPFSLQDAAKLHNTTCVATINSYDNDIEPNVIRPITKRIECIEQVSRTVGKEKVIWNYNPILISPRYSLEHHLKRIPQMFAMIAPFVGRFTFDFVNLYPKVQKNAPEIRTPNLEEQNQIIDLINDMLERYQIPCSTCNQDRVRSNIEFGRCHTLAQLLENSKRTVKPRLSQSTLNDCSICGHIAHRDVGTYNTCPHACRYCYANANYDAVNMRLNMYDISSPMLCDTIHTYETIQEPKTTTYSTY